MATKLMSTMVVVFLLALLMSTNDVIATDCLSVFANINHCRNYLQSPAPIRPGNQCCDAATSLVGNGDIDNLCKCLKQNSLGFLPSKAQQLPNLCSLTTFSPLVKCLVPSDETTNHLTPLIPIPPLTPLLPPLIPIPPLTPLFPLPPFINIPPFTPLLPPSIRIPPLGPLLPPSIRIPPLGPLLPPSIRIPPLLPLPPLLPAPPVA